MENWNVRRFRAQIRVTPHSGARIQYIHEITMSLTVDFAWDAEKPTTRESSPYIHLERERKHALKRFDEKLKHLRKFIETCGWKTETLVWTFVTLARKNESFTEVFETPGWKTETRADLERKLGLHLIQQHEIPLAGSRVTLCVTARIRVVG